MSDERHDHAAAMAQKTPLGDRLGALLRRTSGVSVNMAAGRTALTSSVMPRTTRSAVRLTTKVMREQQDADQEQHPVVVRAGRRLAQLGGDGGGQRAHGVEDAVRESAPRGRWP